MTKPAARNIRVFVVDDHHLVRRGLRLLLGEDPGFTICGEAAHLVEAFAAIPVCHTDVVVVDPGGEDGFELIHRLRREHRQVRILVFSMHEKVLLAEKALSWGADGYLLKSEPPEKIIEAIKAVAKGLRYVSSAVDRTLLDATAGLEWMNENGFWTVRPRLSQ